jgi:hypothetical protein
MTLAKLVATLITLPRVLAARLVDLMARNAATPASASASGSGGPPHASQAAAGGDEQVDIDSDDERRGKGKAVSSCPAGSPGGAVGAWRALLCLQRVRTLPRFPPAGRRPGCCSCAAWHAHASV